MWNPQNQGPHKLLYPRILPNIILLILYPFLSKGPTGEALFTMLIL